MKKLIREPIEIEYDDEKLAIVWTYTIVETLNGKHKHYNVTVNKKFMEITGIRQAVFICKTDKKGMFNVTTREPPENVVYKLEKPHSNKQHTKITLPKKIIKTKKGDKIKIRFYPREKDIYGTGGPRITFEVYTPDRGPKITADVIPRRDSAALLRWAFDGSDDIPEDLEPFLTQKQIEEIKGYKYCWEVYLDTYTLDVDMQPCPMEA